MTTRPLNSAPLFTCFTLIVIPHAHSIPMNQSRSSNTTRTLHSVYASVCTFSIGPFRFWPIRVRFSTTKGGHILCHLGFAWNSCITPLKHLIKYHIFSVYYKMPYYQTWEEFARAAEKLYLTDPMKVINKQPLSFRLLAKSTAHVHIFYSKRATY